MTRPIFICMGYVIDYRLLLTKCLFQNRIDFCDYREIQATL